MSIVPIVLISSGAAVFVVYLLVLCVFQISKYRYTKKLRDGSKIAMISRGSIEYAYFGGGPVVMLLHGTPGDYSQNLLFMKDFIINAGFSILSVSRPGYHRTSIEIGKSLEEQADALTQLLDDLDVDQVASVGTSGGGPLAIEFARLHPDRVWALVLISAAVERVNVHTSLPDSVTKIPRLLFGDGFLEWVMLKRFERKPERILLPEKVLQENPKFVHEETLKKKILADPAQRKLFLKLLWTGMGFPPRLYKDGWMNDIQLYKNSLDLSQSYQIKTPTLFVHGIYDVNARFDAAKELSKQIEGSEFFEFDGGHFGMITHEEMMASAVIDFLSRQTQKISSGE